MSKGEIISHIGEGQYRVRQKLAVERIQQEIEGLNDRIAELAVKIPEKKLELLQAQDLVNDTVRDIDFAIGDLQAGLEGARDAIKGLQTTLIRQQADVRLIEIKVSELIAENLSALKRRGALSEVPEGRELELWCADYTLDLSGEVGLVDINDEGGRGVVIHPGFDEAAVYDAARDGALFPNLAQSAPQIFFNAAILPGVQKWMPRYRLGTITKLVADLCTVELDPAKSSAQDLDINESNTLEEVPIKYMDCDEFAFQEEDRVLVRFTQNGPLVVGFEENPRECDVAFACYITNSFCSVEYDGTPFVADFYKINFSTLELEPYETVELTTNTLGTNIFSGHYVCERVPYFDVSRYADCTISSGSRQQGTVSASGGLIIASQPMQAPANISDSKGVAIASGSDYDQPTLLFIDSKTLAVTGENTPPAGNGMRFERLAANQDTIIVQAEVNPNLTTYGLLSFDLDMNFLASVQFSPTTYYGGPYCIAANSKYAFSVVWGDTFDLFVHDAKTLIQRHVMSVSPFAERMAATSRYVIIGRSLGNRSGQDGRIEIFEITDGDAFGLTLVKTIAQVEDRQVWPIA